MMIGSVAGAFLLPCSSISGPAAVLLKLIMQGFQANSEYLGRPGLIIICRFEGLQDQQLLGFPTVVPTPRRTASGSSAEVRIAVWPKFGGRCLVSTTGPSQTITARSRVFRNSRTFPCHE